MAGSDWIYITWPIYGLGSAGIFKSFPRTTLLSLDANRHCHYSSKNRANMYMYCARGWRGHFNCICHTIYTPVVCVPVYICSLHVLCMPLSVFSQLLIEPKHIQHGPCGVNAENKRGGKIESFLTEHPS